MVMRFSPGKPVFDYCHQLLIHYWNRNGIWPKQMRCLPQDLPTVHYCYTQGSSALSGGPLGGFPSLSLNRGGRVAKPLISHLTPVTRIHIIQSSQNISHQITKVHCHSFCSWS